MLKTYISNFILSKLDIGSVKKIFGNAPILNIIYKIFSQFLVDYKFPAHIFIETTRMCNLKCQSCPRDLSDAQIGHMKFELFKKIIDEATLNRARNFCLHMFGEPLLNPEIVKMAEYIKQANNKHSILLTTNGYFLDEQKAEGLIKAGVDKIVVSFFTLRQDRAKTLTGNDDIDKVVNNIKNAVSLTRKIHGQTKLFIRVLRSKDNEDEIGDFRNLAKRIGARLKIRNTHNYSGPIKNNYTSKAQDRKRYPCYHLWFSPAISWDGKVLLCCSDWNYFEVLGDITKESLAHIWQGERMKELRKLHLLQKYDKVALCKECNVWSLYPDIFFSFQKDTSNKG